MKSTEISRVREGENSRYDQMRNETSSPPTPIADITRHLNHFSDQESPTPLSYTDRIASSSGLSASEKITPPDLAEVLKSRMGRLLGTELSLAHTYPYFLQNGRGGTLWQAKEYYERISHRNYDHRIRDEIAVMSKEDGRRRLNEIFGEGPSENSPKNSPESSPKNSPESSSGSDGEPESDQNDRKQLIHEFVDKVNENYYACQRLRSRNMIVHRMKENKMSEAEYNEAVEYLDRTYAPEHGEHKARHRILETLRKYRQ
jgi:hypothetical protein